MCIVIICNRNAINSTVTAIYDRYRYDKEKRAALEKWAEVLSGIVDRKPVPTDRHLGASTSAPAPAGSSAPKIELAAS